LIYYETLLVINPNLGEDEVETIAQKNKKDHGGSGGIDNPNGKLGEAAFSLRGEEI